MTVAFGICRRYCVLFEVQKVAKACAKQAAFSALNEGEQSADGPRCQRLRPPPAAAGFDVATRPLSYDNAYSLEWPLIATILSTPLHSTPLHSWKVSITDR